MKCQILFIRKNKKNIIKLSSAENAQMMMIWCFTFLSILFKLQSKLNTSNTDGSVTMINSNLFLSPYKILPIVQENKYLGKFS